VNAADALSPNRQRRLIVIATHPIQYYAPLYRLLAERSVVDLLVVYLSDAGAAAHVDADFGRTVSWGLPLLDGYPYTVLQPGTAITSRGFWARYDGGLIPTLERLSPDWVLIYGYASRMNWAALTWARRRGVKVAYASDSNIYDPKRSIIQPVKHLIVRSFFRQVHAFLSPSEANATYLRKFGAPSERIHRLPFAVDVGRFQQNAPAAGVKRPFDFIWAGKFIPLKRAGDFLAALERVSQVAGRPIRALIAGDGSLRGQLTAQARSLPSTCQVEFVGFVNQTAMPSVLQAGSILVFTSDREGYGLIATEAAAAGLALVVSDRIGCVGSTVLARPGVNALTYRAGDVEGLATAMARLLAEPDLRARMQEASFAISREHDLDHAAQVIEGVLVRG